MWNWLVKAERPKETMGEQTFISIVVRNVKDGFAVIAEAREIARIMGLAGRVAGPFTMAGSINVRLEEISESEARQLAGFLARKTNLDAEVMISPFRDYFVDKLRISINNEIDLDVREVPASTPVSRLLDAVLADQNLRPLDLSDANVRVYREPGDGTARVLDPLATLHTNEVRTGDTLALYYSWPDRDFRIVFSFSPAETDAAICRELATRLRSHPACANTSIWHRGMIAPGARIPDTIESEFGRARLIIAIMSADYFRTDHPEPFFPLEKSLVNTRASKINERTGVIPVLGRVTTIQAPFSMLGRLPRGGRAIVQHPDPDSTYTEIAEEIVELVKSMRGA